MSLRSISKLLASMALFACSSLFAAPLVVDVTGIRSNAVFTDAGNTVLSFDVGANATITSFAYTVNLSAFTASWLSDIGLAVSDSGLTTGFFFNPGQGDDMSGTASYADAFDLVSFALDFAVGSDGILRLEFYEDADDLAGADGRWNFGTLTFGVAPAGDGAGEVPEPGSLLLLGAGLAAMGFAARRRAARRRP